MQRKNRARGACSGGSCKSRLHGQHEDGKASVNGQTIDTSSGWGGALARGRPTGGAFRVHIDDPLFALGVA